MKKIIATAAITFTLMNVSAQRQVKYDTLEVLMYDSLGNEYHFNPPRLIIKKHGTYPVIVADVRINKKGRASIKPCSRRREPWYRYSDANVKIGDTIWVSNNDRIEPRF